ncbi:Inositol-1-monophosphatase [Rosistilla carotiformis]|uniref:Inositol-1-monophosphatase n=1 Tax=Rosistilla carotiformis TaxID=2528017 RepID=A0A518JRQ4_9BACT|nr:inositol monophosphatase family protein [Rosistilla carotiformis]QDV68196.1 Inositol-1-monophosphatase [Rosistilla carotiformis]
MNDNYLKVARLAAAAGAEVLLSYQGRFSVREKAPRDLVTEADVAAQQAIQKILLSNFPDHGFVGEEEGHDQVSAEMLADPKHPPIWIVDPLDGTVNYVHQLQSFAVSIAMYHAGELQIGIVHDPVTREIFWAQRGAGAFLNDCPIQCSQTDRLDQALLACSFSAGTQHDSAELGRFAAALDGAQSVRRLGSAALNLCYVAAGRLDGYWATCVKPWDVAAGALIVTEAGGQIRALSGDRFDPWNPRFAATATEPLNDQLLRCIA